MLNKCLELKTKIKSALELQIKPQSAKEIVCSLVDIGGSMKEGIAQISYVSLAAGAIGTGAIIIPKLVITIKENKTLKEQNKELKQIVRTKIIQGELNEQTI